MKNIIIGTAGHIDHGKTTLIKAMTGRETDRLKEEKNRGISIELGFTYFDLPSGRRAGLIDVPGHEKFIKNMLAGVSGMDIVMLVVAADEGVMPQTKEHLHILDMLDIKKGIVVLTKVDMVDEEWLELVMEDIGEDLKGTFLEGAPMLPVSSTKNIGIDQVIKTIDDLTETIEDRDESTTPRLPIDRVFTLTGFGTIVTGTLISGKMEVGDDIQIFPTDIKSRIRSLQVHGEDAHVAYAGQRVAMNLTGVKKSDIERGFVVAPVASMTDTMMLDVKLNLLKDSPRIIENRTRVRIYLGTAEVLGRVVLLDRAHLTPGESCYAQLRLEEQIVAKRGDKFIVRFYSPMMTIGGGEVLEPNPPKRKRFQENVIEELKVKEEGDDLEIIEKIIKDKSKDFPTVKELAVAMVIPEGDMKSAVEALVQQEKVIVFELLKDIHVVHRTAYQALAKRIIDELATYHESHPLKAGRLKEEVRSRYLGKIKPKLGDLIMGQLEMDQPIKFSHGLMALKDFQVHFNDKQKQIKEAIETITLEEKAPMKKEEVLEKVEGQVNEVDEVFMALYEQDVLLQLTDEIYIHAQIFNRAVEKIKAYILEQGGITAAQCRDLLGTSRKYAIALLEESDRRKETRRIGDRRELC